MSGTAWMGLTVELMMTLRGESGLSLRVREAGCRSGFYVSPRSASYQSINQSINQSPQSQVTLV
jgi:hypothetical protein